MFGHNLKKYRTEKGFSQSDLAKKLFVSRQCVSKWESGKTQPDLQMLTQLSELLDVTVDALIKENDNINDNTSNINIRFFAANLLLGLFCILAFFTVWRFLPQTIPAHWTNGVIDRYGSRNEVFIHCITVVVLVSVNLFVGLILRQIRNKKIIYIIYSVISLLQIAYLVFIVCLYGKYLSNMSSFITGLSVSLIMCVSIAIHPKINKQNYLLGVRTRETLKSTAVWSKINAFACYLFSSWSLVLFVIDMIWLSKFVVLLLLGYVLLSVIVIIYSKKCKAEN